MKIAIAALASLSLAVAGCTSNPTVETRTVTVYAPRACQPSPLSSAFALFQPLGDFPPPSSPPASFLLSNMGAPLAGFPSDTEEIVATVTDTNAPGPWAAHSLLASTGNIDLLALPSGTPCTLTNPIAPRAGAVLGAIDEGHVLIVGGTPSTDGGAVPATPLIDLTQGTVATLPNGLLVPRTQATVTAWSGGAVVAGGTDLTGATRADFEIYASSVGDFTGATYALSFARARHGAAELASGETLLIGGVDGSNDLLAPMEAIDPSTTPPRSRTAGLAQLQFPRTNPVVMRLASGEILVAGGLDAAGAPVTMLEWFTPDGSAASADPQPLVASPIEAFLPLGAGGALAVVAPDTSAPDGGADDAGAAVNVWGISAAHGLYPATSLEAPLTDVRLFAGAEGEPILWTGSLWFYWQPWQNMFLPLTAATGAPGPTGDPIASTEPGLGVWTDGTSVFALRSGTRGPYATTPTLTFTDTANLSFKTFVAPDQLLSSGALTLDDEAGLTLQPNASVFVTDATFAAFSLTLTVTTPGAPPPAIVLRDDTGAETVLDGTQCSFPSGSATLQLERGSDDTVSAAVDDGALTPCAIAPAPGARVSIGLRGGVNGSAVRSLLVSRM